MLFCKDLAQEDINYSPSGRHQWDDKYVIDILMEKIHKLWRQKPTYIDHAVDTNDDVMSH